MQFPINFKLIRFNINSHTIFFFYILEDQVPVMVVSASSHCCTTSDNMSLSISAPASLSFLPDQLYTSVRVSVPMSLCSPLCFCFYLFLTIPWGLGLVWIYLLVSLLVCVPNPDSLSHFKAFCLPVSLL